MSFDLKLIGTSHLAMVKDALDEQDAQFASLLSDVDISMFGFPNTLHDAVVVDAANRCIAMRKGVADRDRDLIRKINGTDTFALDADRLCVIGAPTGAKPLLRFVVKNRIDSITGDIDVKGPLISRPAFRALCKPAIERNMAPVFRSDVMRGAVLITAPRPAEALKLRLQSEEGAGEDAIACLGAALDVIEEVAISTYEAMGYRVLRQDRATLAASGMTLEAFNVGSKRIVNNAPRDFVDPFHMNAAYGKLVLEQVVAACR